MDNKRIAWCGSSFKGLLDMPISVRKTFGHALGLAQNGLPYEDAKTLSGFSGRNLAKRDKATIDARLSEVRLIEAAKAKTKRKAS
jgi:phage-related protein